MDRPKPNKKKFWPRVVRQWLPPLNNLSNTSHLSKPPGKEIAMSDHRHINEFFRLDCAPDLLRLRLFPNSKEITESMAAYHAVRWQLLDKCQLRYNDST